MDAAEERCWRGTTGAWVAEAVQACAATPSWNLRAQRDQPQRKRRQDSPDRLLFRTSTHLRQP